MIKPYTKMETLEIILAETENQLNRCEIMDRLYSRVSLGGTQVNQEKEANQSQIRNFRQVLNNLKEIHKAMLEEEALSPKELPKEKKKKVK